MMRFLFFLSVLFSFSNLSARCVNLQDVMLSDYGLVDSVNIIQTINKAVSDINGKRLILPNSVINVDDVIIEGKSHFVIVGSKTHPIVCKNFRISDCHDFDLSNLYIKGTKEKFATFFIVGDCEKFQIHDCLFDSEKDSDGNNTFYGVHVITDENKPLFNYHNSPRNFKIYNNAVNNTRYDGILTHAYCSNFVIENNVVNNASCIGIEVEGRLGGNNNTTVHPCKNAIIRNNQIRNSGSWGMLLMWVDNIKVYNNKSYNAIGAFLSIGCSNLLIQKNYFEGKLLGFEISQEYFKILNGINNDVRVFDNRILAMARGENRGVVDIRHARNILIKKNVITSYYRDKTAYISLASCQGVTIKNNKFEYKDKPLHDLYYRTNVVDPETQNEVPELDIKDINSQKIVLRKIKQ